MVVKTLVNKFCGNKGKWEYIVRFGTGMTYIFGKREKWHENF